MTKKWILQKDDKCDFCDQELSQGSNVYLDEKTEEIICQDCGGREEMGTEYQKTANSLKENEK